MKIKKINERVFALQKKNKSKACYEIELDDFKTNASFQRNAANIESMIDRYETDPELLTTKMFHVAGDVNGTKIYRFASGKLRLYCVKEKDRILILSHSALKKTQTTDDKDSEKAYRTYEKYLELQNKKRGS